MQFEILEKPTFSVLKIILEPAESYRAEAGAMIAMSSNIELQAKTSGKGLLGSIKAAVGGESFFASLYVCHSKPGELWLAPGTIGDIIHTKLNGRIFAQGGAYLAGTPDLTISTKGSFKAMISGEGLFLQEISGTGDVFFGSYGTVIERTLEHGETFIVDTGHIVAFEESVHYSIKKASKGIFSSIASGEGLVCEYTGPGKIWMQTRNLSAFAQLLMRFIPTK